MPKGLKKDSSAALKIMEQGAQHLLEAPNASTSEIWMKCYELKIALYCTHAGAQRSCCFYHLNACALLIGASETSSKAAESE